MFLDESGEPVPGKSQLGALAAGVPGTVAGLLFALEHYGTMQRPEVLSDAILLAWDGFHLDARLAASLAAEEPLLVSHPSSKKVFSKDGRVLRKDELLVQSDLAQTLGSISDKGRDGFYAGEVAELIDISMRRGGGIISKEDLSSYAPVDRSPLSGSYHAYSILTAPPPSAGGITVLQMLNVLEEMPVGETPYGSALYYHLIAGAAQLSYADRSAYAGDQDHVLIPVDTLISKSYARERRKLLSGDRAVPGSSLRPGIATPSVKGGETTHYCVVDKNGNVASVTVSLNDVYGGRVFVEGAGFFLNDVMDDFVIKPSSPNLYGLTGGASNEVGPGRRMASSMSPTILLLDGRPQLVLGARGGSRIPTTVVQVIVGVVDYGLPLQTAVSSPRIHHQWNPDVLMIEPALSGTPVAEELGRMGYRVREIPSSPGRVQAAGMRDGVWWGFSDPREGGSAGGF